MRAVLFFLGVLAVSAASRAEAQYTPSPGPCSAGNVPDSSCAFIVVKPTFVVKNLHPVVDKVSVWCSVKIGEPDTWIKVESPPQSTIAGDASFAPNITAPPVRLGILKSSISAGQVFALTCELLLTRSNANGTLVKAVAVANASAPQTPTDTNWNQVATGSVVKWTQNVTFPAATP